ncbi:MAG: CHASE domain-containing protein, partial [Acidobacteriota bacterium]
MTGGSGTAGHRSGPESSRFTGRRLRSALSSWRASIHGTDVLIASVLAALSLGLGAYLFARAQAATHLAFTERAQRLQASVGEGLRLPQEDLTSLSRFLEAVSGTTRRQFHLLAGPILTRHRLVYAFEWLPVVRESERDAYESEARAAGLSDYRFWELADGKQRAAGRRDFYVPIHFMEPPSSLALGFDIAADPLRWSTAERARDSGAIAASQPFELLEDAGNRDASPVVAMYAPIYRGGDPASDAARRAALTGFAMAIFRAAPLVGNAAAAVDASGLGLVLRDPGAPAKRPLAERPAGAAALPRRSGFQLDFPVEFADKRWTLSVFALPGAFLPPKRGAIGIASAGLV